MAKMKTEYKRIRKGNKTAAKTLLYFVNREGLKGWELFNRATGSHLSFTIYHFRKRIKAS